MAANDFLNTTILKHRSLLHLFTTIRDKNTQRREYVVHCDRLLNILAEEGLASLATEEITIETPCGPCKGLKPIPASDICSVSIVRSGDILLEAVRRCLPDISVGKILCQRDESDEEKRATLYYAKLPGTIVKQKVLLVDPMLATGGSACKAIDVLNEAGVDDSQITFLVTVAAPEGLRRINKEHPKIKIVCAAVDTQLNEHKFIVPGLGDFGDRYYGTEECIGLKDIMEEKNKQIAELKAQLNKLQN